MLVEFVPHCGTSPRVRVQRYLALLVLEVVYILLPLGIRWFLFTTCPSRIDGGECYCSFFLTRYFVAANRIDLGMLLYVFKSGMSHSIYDKAWMELNWVFVVHHRKYAIWVIWLSRWFFLTQRYAIWHPRFIASWLTSAHGKGNSSSNCEMQLRLVRVAAWWWPLA